MIKRFKFILFFLLLSSSIFSQSKSSNMVSVHFDDIDLASILDSLSNQIDLFFSYNSSILEGTGKFSISAENEPIDQFLSRLLVGTGIEYSFFKDQIILNYKPVQNVSRKKNMFTISGKLRDENGDFLANVSVFLDGTTIGSSTDIDGNFKLESIPPGYYDLVFSHVGYKNAVHSISEFNGGSRILNHNMELDLNELEEVEIVSKRITENESEWQTNFVIFRKELLGNSANASKCVIENPEVINFTFDQDKRILRAYASDPIQIRNDALGYRVTYFLESFEKTSNNLRYRGQIRFRNDVPLKNSEKRGWNKNRKISYNGSFNHFRDALLDSNLKREGFKIYSLSRLSKLGEKEKLTELSAEDIVVFKGDHYELEFKNFLLVSFRKEKESVDFLNDLQYSTVLYDQIIDSRGVINKIPGNQLSIIKLLKKSVRLDLNGQIEDRFALTSYGYWSWERLGDLVPINYDPKLDKL